MYGLDTASQKSSCTNLNTIQFDSSSGLGGQTNQFENWGGLGIAITWLRPFPNYIQTKYHKSSNQWAVLVFKSSRQLFSPGPVAKHPDSVQSHEAKSPNFGQVPILSRNIQVQNTGSWSGMHDRLVEDQQSSQLAGQQVI